MILTFHDYFWCLNALLHCLLMLWLCLLWFCVMLSLSMADCPTHDAILNQCGISVNTTHTKIIDELSLKALPFLKSLREKVFQDAIAAGLSDP